VGDPGFFGGSVLLEGKRIIVTGGARGIAAGTVRSYVREGAQVAVMDIRDELGRQVVDEASALGPGEATYYHCDAADRKEVFEVFDSAIGAMGGLEVLAHVVGVNPGFRLAEEIDDKTWDFVFDVNVKGTLYTNQAVCAHMRKQGYGKIINYGSPAGLVGSAGCADYGASKGAVISWSRSIAKEWGRYGIRVNVVNPAIETPLRHEALANSSAFEPDGPLPISWAPTDEQWKSQLLVFGKTGLKGDAEQDMGPVMVFLASEGSDFMTGQMFNVDGGLCFVR
jgi:NAD(P)-dependent dehydrogenase (short-subunit alcohol dehydrogenase family)